MQDHNPSSESIRNLMDTIEAERLALPEFQRDFVWDLSKTHDLFDSLVRDVFIGSLIYGVPSFAVTTRELDTRPRKGKGSRRRLGHRSYSKQEIDTLRQTPPGFRLILDGQQRITALYRGLTGADSVWFVAKDLMSVPEKSSLVDYLDGFERKSSDSALSIALPDVWRMVQGQLPREQQKEDLLRESPFVKALDPDTDQWSSLFEHYLTITEQLQDLLKAEKLLSYHMLDTSVEQFALFFERSNSKGIRLSFIDILAAKLYAGFNLRSHFEAFEDDWPQIRPNREILVRMVALIRSQSTEVKKSYILEMLGPEDFENYWTRTTELYAQTIDYLRTNRWIISERYLPYDVMLLPIMAFLDSLPQRSFSQASAEQIDFLQHWYWSSIFSERYSAKTNETVLADSQLLQTVARGEKAVPGSYLRRFLLQLQNEEDILDVRSPGSALFRGLMSLLHFEGGGLRDLRNGSTVRIGERVDSHHIFPRKYLQQEYAGPPDEKALVNSVANRTRIPKLTNIKIGKKAPSVYLSELAASNPDLRVSLEVHAIDPAILSGKYDKDFLEFLLDRSERMLRLVRARTTASTAVVDPFLAPEEG